MKRSLSQKGTIARANWAVIAGVAGVGFTFLGLCFGIMSWYIDAKNKVLRETLTERRLLAEDREHKSAQVAQEAQKFARAVSDSLVSRERRFQAQVVKLGKQLDEERDRNQKLATLLMSVKSVEALREEQTIELQNMITELQEQLRERINSEMKTRTQLDSLLVKSKRAAKQAETQTWEVPPPYYPHNLDDWRKRRPYSQPRIP